MTAISYKELYENFEKVLQKLSKQNEPIKVLREDEKSFVMMSLKEYEALSETLFLLKKPVDADQLKRAVEDFKASKRNYHTRELIEE